MRCDALAFPSSLDGRGTLRLRSLPSNPAMAHGEKWDVFRSEGPLPELPLRPARGLWAI
jgi:hypothetical protein